MNKRGFIYTFLLRWTVCTIGLWIATGLFQGAYQNRLVVALVAGAILALVNALIKPIIVLASLPAILLTMGIFMVIINGLTVYLVSLVYQPLHIDSFGVAILTGIIIAFVNYLVTSLLESRK